MAGRPSAFDFPTSELGEPTLERIGEPDGQPLGRLFDSLGPSVYRREMISFHSHILQQATWLCHRAKSLRAFGAPIPEKGLGGDRFSAAHRSFKDLASLKFLLESKRGVLN
jgi:hypothetical protein